MIITLYSTTSTIKQVAQKNNMGDNRTTRKWLNSLNVKIIKQGGRDYIYDWDLEFAKQCQMVENLKIRHPINWHRLYDEGTDDKEMVKDQKGMGEHYHCHLNFHPYWLLPCFR